MIFFRKISRGVNWITNSQQLAGSISFSPNAGSGCVVSPSREILESRELDITTVM